jgi:hypothetical protein
MPKEKLLITKAQYSALDNIRGLEQSVHFMVMCARETPKGYVLEGDPDTFDHLQDDLSDEIYHEMSPPSRLKHLRSLMLRLEPDSDL